MAHYGIICPEYAGHLFSVGNLGVALMHRGHRVTVFASARSADTIHGLGLGFHQLPIDVSSHLPWTLLGQLAYFVGARGFIKYRNQLTLQAKDYLRTLPAALEAHALDGLIVDQIVPAGATVAEHLGLPYVTVCSAIPTDEDPNISPVYVPWGVPETKLDRAKVQLAYAGMRWVYRPVRLVLNRQRRAWGLPELGHIDESTSPLAQIVQFPEAFDFPARRPPDHLHYVGHLSATRPQSVEDFPWERLDGRPLIYASAGTIAIERNGKALRRILEACVGVDAQLVMGLGQWVDGGGVRNLVQPDIMPDNAIVVGFAPQIKLLERADLMITHGGINSVNEALLNGVPLVVMPRDGDQPGAAARVAAAGVGLTTSFDRTPAEQLRKLIVRALNDTDIRAKAKRMQQAISSAGGAIHAAEITERALQTRRPVLRREFA